VTCERWLYRLIVKFIGPGIISTYILSIYELDGYIYRKCDDGVVETARVYSFECIVRKFTKRDRGEYSMGHWELISIYSNNILIAY